MRIAMLHLAPRLGSFSYNHSLLQTAVIAAAEMGAEWVVTPELFLSGYDFSEVSGVDWIGSPADTHIERLCGIAASRGITMFVGHPEYSAESGKRYNSAFVIGSNGQILGIHR